MISSIASLSAAAGARPLSLPACVRGSKALTPFSVSLARYTLPYFPFGLPIRRERRMPATPSFCQIVMLAEVLLISASCPPSRDSVPRTDCRFPHLNLICIRLCRVRYGMKFFADTAFQIAQIVGHPIWISRKRWLTARRSRLMCLSCTLPPRYKSGHAVRMWIHFRLLRVVPAC